MPKRSNERNDGKARDALAHYCGDGAFPPSFSGFEGKLGEHLRQYYDLSLAEPMPEKFRQLLTELAKLDGET
jgi:hypothetical protein